MLMTTLVEQADPYVVPQLCALCSRPLTSSPSDDFCSENCQQKWHAARMTDQSITRAA